VVQVGISLALPRALAFLDHPNHLGLVHMAGTYSVIDHTESTEVVPTFLPFVLRSVRAALSAGLDVGRTTGLTLDSRSPATFPFWASLFTRTVLA
jgi:hypothetical protein